MAEAELGRLWEVVQGQAVQINRLKESHYELRADHEVLLECLELAGTFSRQALLAVGHRRRCVPPGRDDSRGQGC